MCLCFGILHQSLLSLVSDQSSVTSYCCYAPFSNAQMRYSSRQKKPPFYCYVDHLTTQCGGGDNPAAPVQCLIAKAAVNAAVLAALATAQRLNPVVFFGFKLCLRCRLETFFQLDNTWITRGHQWKPKNIRCNTDLHQQYFSERIINMCGTVWTTTRWQQIRSTVFQQQTAKDVEQDESAIGLHPTNRI